MKKLFYLFLILPVLFIACSDDDDDDYGGKIDPQEQIFKNGLIKQIDDAKYIYNSKGQLEKIVEGYGATITFTYDKKFTKSSASADVKMTVANGGDLDVYYMQLGGNGFVKSFVSEYEYNEGGEKYRDITTGSVGYNGAGQVSKMTMTIVTKNQAGKEIYNDVYVTEISYKDGSISKTVYTEEGEDADRTETNFTYTSETQKEGLENISGLMLWDSMLGVDFDYVEYAYYAGILGKPSNKLPLTSKSVDSEDYKENYTYEWKLDDKKMPTEVKAVRDGNTEYPEIYTFVW